MSPSKKVLYLITKANFGGAQRYVFDLVVHAAHSGYDVAVAYGEHGLLVEKLAGAHIRTIELPLENNMRVLQSFALIRALVRMLQAERPDIVHLNSSKAAFFGSIAARIAGVPRIVFTAHGWTFNEPRPFFERFIVRILHMVTVVFCHHTIYVSRALKRQIGIASLFPHSVIHNGIEMNAPLLSRADAREKLETLFPHIVGTQLIATIAELHPIKGLEYLIEAAADVAQEHPRTHFIIFGEGKDRTRLETLITQKKAPVTLAGFVADAPQYLPACDVFVLSSLSEGLGYVLLEAGRAKLPVITTSVGGTPEVIDAQTGVLIPARDHRALTSALQTLLANEDKRTRLAIMLQQKIAKVFSLDRMLARTLETYSN